MTALRFLLAWTLYGLGDLIWRVFDQWTGFGLRGPLYQAYNAIMLLSDAVQGGGPGPWSPAD